MSYLKRILRTQQFKNGIWLYILQFFQMIIPLMTFPYVTRVLGAQLYGDFSVALVVITYIQILVEYGFNYSGTRKLALLNKDTYSEVYSNVFGAKFVLSIISIIIMIIIFGISKYSEIQKVCMLCLIGIIVGSLLQQTWVFQGLQQMKYITLANVIARVISVVLIFLFVRDSKDILLYCFLYASTNVISGIISVFICKKQFGLRLSYYGIKKIGKELKDGFSLFLTSAMAKIVASIGTLFLGIYASSYEVGVYSAVQKIPNIMVMCYSPIGQVLFPYTAKLFCENGIAAKRIVKILCGPIMGLVALICALIAILAQPIIQFLCGSEYLGGNKYLYILLIWTFFSIFNNVLGSLILVASGRSKEYTTCFVISVFFALLLNYILAINYSCMGVAFATLISECLLTAMMILTIIVHKKEIFGYGF